jgi:DNA-binding XRE family transcriptional regulator
MTTRILEKSAALSDLDRFEHRLSKRPAYRKLRAKASTVSKVAAKVIRYRQAHDLSQGALAKAAGLSRKALNEIEGLVNTNPSLKTLEALADAMRLPLPKLLA